MNSLDPRTIFLSYTLCNLICAVVMVNLWRQNRFRFNGLGLCMLSFVLNFLGVLLLALRGEIADFLSIIVGNLVLATSILLLYAGLAQFLGRKVRQVHNYFLLGAYLALQAWLVYVFPNLHLRTLNFSYITSIYILQMIWLLASEKNPSNRSITRGLWGILGVFIVLIIIRIINEFINPSGKDLLVTNPIETVIYLGFQIVYLAMVFMFFIMINKKLVYQLELDIRIQHASEAELKLSQEKFFKAFESSPASVLISQTSDGKFIDVNSRFLVLSGYSREELLSSNLSTLDMWVDIKERDRMIQMIRKEGSIKDFEFKGKTKTGEIITLSYSGEIIFIGEKECLLSMLLDITESKQIEAVLKLQITLWQYSTTHNSAELMLKALDEIEALTESQISFFHIVDAKSDALKLQVWSTKTKKYFCTAKGDGIHYPIEQAGVWCDAVRERKPLIHNDYENLPNKKGMPEGHAKVVRELVIPIMRDKIVKAVIGVGNKAADYTEKDIDLVTNVANIAWFILQEKQDDEEIQNLNLKLENLAMTDELTKIANRRAFFIKGAEEITRARRYHAPLSIIMLDVDRFKLINDTLGHDSGDFALQTVAATLVEGVREVDEVGRLGGEEFAILLPNTKIEDAKNLAERLRIAIAENSDFRDKLKMDITASFGVAEYQLQIKNLDELLKNADTAMYKAKNRGRNRVELFTSENI